MKLLSSSIFCRISPFSISIIKIVVLVFDSTHENTFKGLSFWHDEVKENLGNDVVVGICGNKSDLFLEEKVSEEECQKYAKEINAKFVYTSAKMDKTGFTRFLKILFHTFKRNNYLYYFN